MAVSFMKNKQTNKNCYKYKCKIFFFFLQETVIRETMLYNQGEFAENFSFFIQNSQTTLNWTPGGGAAHLPCCKSTPYFFLYCPLLHRLSQASTTRDVFSFKRGCHQVQKCWTLSFFRKAASQRLCLTSAHSAAALGLIPVGEQESSLTEAVLGFQVAPGHAESIILSILLHSHLAHLAACYFCFTGCCGAGEGYWGWDFHEENRVFLLVPGFSRKDKSHTGKHAMKDELSVIPSQGSVRNGACTRERQRERTYMCKVVFPQC